MICRFLGAAGTDGVRGPVVEGSREHEERGAGREVEVPPRVPDVDQSAALRPRRRKQG